MKFRWDKKYLYWGITALIVIGVSIILFFLIFHGTNFKDGVTRLTAICMPIIDGVVLAYLLTPILNYLERAALKYLFKKKSSELTSRQKKYLRSASIVVTLLLVSIMLYSFFSVVLPQLFQSIQNIVLQFPVYIHNLSLWLEDILENDPRLEARFIDAIETYSPELREWLNGTLLPQMNQAILAVSSYAFSILKALWNLILGLILSIYLLYGKEKFLGQAKKITYSAFEVKRANEIVENCRFIHRTFGGFLGGKLLDSLIIGLLCFVGTTIIGTPYPVLISVIIGVTNIIPFFGPYLGAIPSALLILMIEPMQCLYFLIFILILQQFDGNFLGPKILGNSTGLSGFWVIFAITIFGGFLGVLGMVIGVPTFAVIYALIRRKVEQDLKKKDLPTETREYQGLVHINVEDHTFICNDTEPSSIRPEPSPEERGAEEKDSEK